LTDPVFLPISVALAGFFGARHLKVGATCASVAAVGSGNRLSGLKELVVEGAFAFVLRAGDHSVLVAPAHVTLHVERLTQGEVLSVVDAFADLVGGDDFAVGASVLLALVGRLPDGAGHSDGAHGLGGGSAGRDRRRRRLALIRNVAFHLFADFADALAAVVFGGKLLAHREAFPVVNALVVRLALRSVAVDFGGSVDEGAGAITVGILDVFESGSGSVSGATVHAHIVALCLGRNIYN